MRLRTLESYWLMKNGLIQSYPSLQENTDAELVVIGGGITGALICHALCSKGHQVLLIDSRDIGQGSTAATTSLLQYEIDVNLVDLAEKIGQSPASKCYLAGVKAIETLEKIVRDLSLEVGFERKQSLYLAHNSDAKKSLLKEWIARDKIGLDVNWMDKSSLYQDFGLVGEGAILSVAAASVDAFQMAHALIGHNRLKGSLRVFDQTKIEKMDIRQDKARLETNLGFKIESRKVIFCTGYEGTHMLKQKVAKLFDTYASISEEQIQLPEKLYKTIVWDTHKPYHYIRTTDDGRLLIGGGDTSFRIPFLKQTMKEKKAAELSKVLFEMLPEVNFVEDYSWSGVFGSTEDGLPYIGVSPEFPFSYFVLAFGGNGICFSIQAMEMVLAWLDMENHPLSLHYGFDR